jgi:NAD(P)H-hydrate epimerase
MNRAARVALDAARAAYPDACRWQVICGGGNNGGDGWVLARLAAEQGIGVSVLALVTPDSLEGDAAKACRDYTAAGGAHVCWEDSLDPRADLLVDAVLGSGLSRAVGGDFAAALDAMNRHAAPVVSLDVPSGLSADSGGVLGIAVRAALTVTFVGLKTGLFLGQGPDHAGRLVFSALDIPAECRAGILPRLRRIDDAELTRALPPRTRGAHKGDFGHLLVIGGAPGMAGAARLAAEAALRSGAGRVSVATAPAHCAAINAGCPEIMCHGAPDARALEPLLARASAVAIGPGLGTGEWGRAMWHCALGRPLPMVVDADALNLLAAAPLRGEHWILTPHPGEAGRLTGRSATEVQADRLAVLEAIVGRYGGTVVLKGAGTLVSASDGSPRITTAGNPGMATAGAGDVLTGVIGGLLAQGIEREAAAWVGVEVHARAGDLAAADAPRGTIASDLLPALRRAVNPGIPLPVRAGDR